MAPATGAEGAISDDQWRMKGVHFGLGDELKGARIRVHKTIMRAIEYNLLSRHSSWRVRVFRLYRRSYFDNLAELCHGM